MTTVPNKIRFKKMRAKIAITKIIKKILIFQINFNKKRIRKNNCRKIKNNKIVVIIKVAKINKQIRATHMLIAIIHKIVTKNKNVIISNTQNA